MKLTPIDITDDYECLYLIPISDIHIGDPCCNIDKLQRYIKWVQDTPNARILLNGDLMNTAIKSSVSDTYEETLNPREQIKLATRLFEPVREKIFGIVSGNHERRIQRDTSLNPCEILASNIGIRYFGDEAFIKIRFGKKGGRVSKPLVYHIFATHGWAGGRTPGSKVNNLQKLGEIVLADIYIASHTHFMTSHQDIFYVPDPFNCKVRQVKRTFVSSGAFLDRGGYAAQKGYPGSKLGSPRVRMDGRRHDVHVSI